MKIDKEEHREILLMAVSVLPISGPAGDPDLKRHVLMVHEMLEAIKSAALCDVETSTGPDAAQIMLSQR